MDEDDSDRKKALDKLYGPFEAAMFEMLRLPVGYLCGTAAGMYWNATRSPSDPLPTAAEGVAAFKLLSEQERAKWLNMAYEALKPENRQKARQQFVARWGATVAPADAPQQSAPH